MATAEGARFVMGFVEASRAWRNQFEGIWRELYDNFFVRTAGDVYGAPQAGYAINDPYRHGSLLGGAASFDAFTLKDPETHRSVMKFASALTRTVFGDRRGEFLTADPVGYEDVDKGTTASRLLRRYFTRRGVYRTVCEAFTEMPLIGTTVLEVGYEYREVPTGVRSVGPGYDRMGVERVIARDGPSLRMVPCWDFFPDPYEDRIERMCGAAKRFQISLYCAEQLAESGVYDGEAVEAAKLGQGSNSVKAEWRNLSQGFPDAAQNGRGPLVGYEYHGEYKDGSRKTITVLEGEEVRNTEYVYADPELPFYDIVMNPVAGRFYGLSPAEVMRYDQDLADCLKELSARAVIRSVHPPIAYDPDTDVDQDLLRRWYADMPIPVRGGPNSIGTLKYDADVGKVFAMHQRLTADMQGSGGATAALLGSPGPDREAASVGALRFQAANDLLEFAAGVLERDCLPAMALAVLRRYQQFTSDEDLPKLVGERPEHVDLADIMGEFDIRFIGSRLASTRQQKLAAYQTLIGLASAVPAMQVQIPWSKLAQAIIGDLLELPEAVAAVGTEGMASGLAMMLARGGFGQSPGAPAPGPSGAITEAQGAGAPAL